MPIQPSNLLWAFDALLKRARLPHMRFHDLRRSCATLLAVQDIPPRVITEILGHSNKQYVEHLVLHGIAISMADVGQPTQNALAERFIRTLKEEHVDYTEYVDFMDAEGQLRHWLEVEYNQQRIHSALAYTTPAEFEDAFWAETRQSPSCR